MEASSYLTSASEYHTGISSSACSKTNSPFLWNYFCLCIFFTSEWQHSPPSHPRKYVLFIHSLIWKNIYLGHYLTLYSKRNSRQRKGWNVTARRSNESILPEINPEYSLEGLLLKLKLKLQYFDHLTRRACSLEKTLMLERLMAGGKRGNWGWDGWMSSLN